MILNPTLCASRNGIDSEIPLLTDTIGSLGDIIAVNVTKVNNLVLQCKGTFSAVNCAFEASLDSTDGTDGTWFGVQASRSSANTVEASTGSLSATPTYCWELSVNAYRMFRIRSTAWTSGTQTWLIQPGERATEPVPAVASHAVTLTSTTVGGLAAHDAAISGSPVRQGLRALTANYPAVASGDTADAVSTLVGAKIIKPYSIPEGDFTYTGTITTTTSTAMKSAGAAGIRNYCTGFQIVNGAATATTVTILDGSTAVWTGYLPGTVGASLAINFPTPLRGTAATALNVQLGTATTAYINAQGYQAP